jgi:F0F1-type ATP synthase membrane subunit b/b'
MGMFTKSYADNTIGSIDENYKGIYGCLQIVSDAIHNEQVMFESLFADDYMDAINEAEESVEEKGPNAIQKMGAFILKMIKDLRAKIDSIINDFISKADAKKSKKLKELAAKLPSGLTIDDDKVKKLIDKYGFDEEKFVGGNFKERFEEAYKTTKFILDNKKIDTTGFFSILTDAEDADSYTLLKDSPKLSKIYVELVISFAQVQYNPKTNPDLFLKNLHDPSYIIDSIVKELRDMRSKTKSILDSQEKEIKYSISQAKKDKDKELVKSLKKNKTEVNIINFFVPKWIGNLTKSTIYTYKAYLSSLEYLTKDSKKSDKKSTSKEDDVEVLQGTVESVEYQVDMEFDVL